MFSDYLITCNTCVVFTDNNLLTDYLGQRWISSPSLYNFTIRYKSGKSNSDADGLSRLPFQDGMGFTEIRNETIRTICGMQIVHPCTETLCMTANDCPGDIDIYNDIVPSDWRVNQPLWSVSTPRNPSNWSVWSTCLWNFPKVITKIF